MTTTSHTPTARAGAAVRRTRATAPRIGVDLVDVRRFARLLDLRGPDVRELVFTSQELHDSRGAPERLAARFAAKEATAKALGTGIGPIAWRDVEVRTGPRGEPTICLHGGAAALAHRLALTRWAVSLSHDVGRAVAVVVAERKT
jgi:holo-[acyl-carrier protein] synthase